MSETRCECQDPPGGGTTCEAHQMAICRIRNGQCHAACVDPPDSARADSTAFQNWALSIITRQSRAASTPLTNQDVVILQSGFYRSPIEIVHFVLPADWRLVTTFP